jgi:hypothetical protein
MEEQSAGRSADKGSAMARRDGGANSVHQCRFPCACRADDEGMNGFGQDASCRNEQKELGVFVFSDDICGVAQAFSGVGDRIFSVQHGSGALKKFGVAELTEGAIPLCFLLFFIGSVS